MKPWSYLPELGSLIWVDVAIQTASIYIESQAFDHQDILI